MPAKFWLSTLVVVLLVSLLAVDSRAADRTWIGNPFSSNNWDDGGNWFLSVPAGPGDAAIFGYIGDLPTNPWLNYSLNLNGNRTVDSINFDSSSNYTLSGDTLTAAVFTSMPGPGGVHTINSNVALPDYGDFNIYGSALQINGVVSGSFGFLKRGDGNLGLGGTNTFSGGVTISEGSLAVSTDSNLGAAGSPVTFQGGSLSLVSISPQSFLNRPLITDGGDAIIHANTGPYTFYNGISGSGGLVKNGAGILLFRNTPASFEGDVTINDGVLTAQLNDFIPDKADVNITSASGVYRMQGGLNGTETIGSLSGMGTTEFAIGTGQHLRIGANNNDSTYNGTIQSSISGDGHITKIGTGKLTLGGNNTYTEGTTLRDGTLSLQHNNAVGTGTITVSSFATESFATITEDFSSGAGSFSLNGTAVVDAGSVRLTQAFNNNLGSAVSHTLEGGTLQNFDASFDFRIGGGSGADGMSFSLLDASTHNNTALFNEDGPGADSLTVSFDVYQNSGEPASNFVEVFHNGVSLGQAIPTFSLDNNVNHNAVVSFDNGMLNLTVTPDGSSGEQLFTNLAVSGFAPSSLRVGYGARTGGLTHEHRFDDVSFTAVMKGEVPTLDYSSGVVISNAIELPSNVKLNVASGEATQAGSIGGSGDLTKRGAGQLTLSAASTYSGGTTIAEGTLLANNTTGSATGTGAVQVIDGTLGGTGSVSGAVNSSGGTIAPGASVGKLTVGSVNFDSGSTFAVELGGSGGVAGVDFDQLLVSGTTTLGGNLTIDLLDGFIPSEADSFTVLSAGDLSNSFSNIADGARLAILAGTADFLVNYDGTTDTVVLSDFAPILDGDLNIDGFVDAADAGIMFGNWGPTKLGYFDGNINGDGFIDAADFGTVATNWTGDTGPVGATIPEPSSLLLASLAGCALLHRRQR